MINFYDVSKYCRENNCDSCGYYELCDELMCKLVSPAPCGWTNELIELLNNSVYANEKTSSTPFEKIY